MISLSKKIPNAYVLKRLIQTQEEAMRHCERWGLHEHPNSNEAEVPPSGRIFYLEFTYGNETKKPPIISGGLEFKKLRNLEIHF